MTSRSMWLGRALVAATVAALSLPVVGPPASAGSDLAAIAAANHRSVPDMRRVLADPTTRIGTGNRLYYVDPLPPADAIAAPDEPDEPNAPDRADGADAARLSPDGTPALALHSRPGSPRVIYLDFDGHTVAGTGWNDLPAYQTPSSFDAEPFSLDSSAAFSAAEDAVVRSVWQGVAEDFSIFDVDVTTEDPGQAAITRTSEADERFGTRVVITNTSWIYDRCSCRGVAFGDVLSRPDAQLQPAFVFNRALAGDPKPLAEVAAHEVGHNLGLDHDGQLPDVEYYPGHGAWAPIMGHAFYRPVSQWSRGEYPGADNQQDDLAIIGANGLTLLADDNADRPEAAADLPVTLSAGTDGVITSDGDVDVFRARAGAGPASFSVTPADQSPNLDVRLELRDQAGAVVAEANPPTAFASRERATGTAASLSVDLPRAGSYHLFVSGEGMGDPATGYSGYGSVGRYTVTAATQAPPPTVPDAPAITSTRPGAGQVEVAWSPPPWDGGSPVLRYTVRAVPGGAASTAGGDVRATVVSGLPSGTSSTFEVVATTALGDSAPSAPVTATPSAYASLPAPVRLLDTRPQPTVDGLFSGSGPAAAGSTTELRVGGRAGIPAGASAVVLNVTAVTPAGAGYVTVFPCGQPRPTASHLNFSAGEVVANAVVTGLGADGKVCLSTSAASQLVVDASAVLAPPAVAALPAPVRLLDTRPEPTADGLFSNTGVAAAGSTTELVVPGRAGIPAGAGAAVLNVTAVPAGTVPTPSGVGAGGYVTVFPCGQGRPTASHLNHSGGDVVANAVVTSIGADGRICLFTSAAVHLVVDASALLASSAFSPLPAPVRLLDTRGGPTVDGRFSTAATASAGSTTELPVTGRAGLAAEAAAATLNVTVVAPAAGGYVTVFPCGQPRPTASNLNYGPGDVVANAVITSPGPSGTACLYTSAAAHLVVDASGTLS